VGASGMERAFMPPSEREIETCAISYCVVYSCDELVVTHLSLLEGRLEPLMEVFWQDRRFHKLLAES
jgi:hypothetical protein